MAVATTGNRVPIPRDRKNDYSRAAPPAGPSSSGSAPA
jgi:hypothetical protein